jgi:hypothetical protein
MKYFLHDSNAFQDEKVTELFMKFGYEGVGLFYTILEKLAAQEKPVKTSVLKQQLFVGKKLEKCWRFLEQIGLISSNNGETFNKNLLNHSKKYQIKKEQTRERVAKFRENQAFSEKSTDDVTRYSRVSNADKDNISKDNISNIKNGRKPNKVVSPETTVFNMAKDYWLNVFHPGWHFDGAKGKALKSLLAKIKKLLNDRSREPDKPEPNNEEVLNLFIAFCQHLPEYYKTKDLLIIDSKYNEILEELKLKHNGTKQQSTRQTAYDSAAAFRT